MTLVWVIPVVLIGILLIWVFYEVVKTKGGSGVKSEGKTLLDEPMPGKAPLPPKRPED